jgi:glycosyltransferase involved in cell wall biosynthesis
VKRLLLCPPLFPPSRGGSQDLFADLATLWCGDGGEAVVYTCATEPGTPTRRASSQITVRRFPSLWAGRTAWQGRILSAASLLGPRSWQAALGFPHLVTRGYRSHLRHQAQQKDGPFDLLLAGVLPHTHFLEPAVRFATRHGIPWIAIPLLHTGLLENRRMNQVAGRGAGGLLAQANHVIAMTPAEIPTLTALGVSPEKISVLPVALMESQVPVTGPGFSTAAPLQEPYILQAGALAADKGTLDLIAAQTCRIERGATENLILAGRPQAEVLQALDRLPESIRRGIHLVSEPDDATWHSLLTHAALLVQPSRADAFGRVILEAWRAGCPVLVAAAGGLPHVVAADVNGRVFPVSDVKALMEGMDDLLSHPQVRAGLATAGQKRFLDSFTWEQVYPSWRELFQRIMQDHAEESAA